MNLGMTSYIKETIRTSSIEVETGEEEEEEIEEIEEEEGEIGDLSLGKISVTPSMNFFCNLSLNLLCFSLNNCRLLENLVKELLRAFYGILSPNGPNSLIFIHSSFLSHL